MKKTNVYFPKLNIFKLIAALMVVIIHTNPLRGINDSLNFILVNSLSRIAVPFFFTCAGYMFSKSKSLKGDGYFSKFIKSLLKSYLFWNLIYIPVGLIQLSQGVLSNTQLSPSTMTPITLISRAFQCILVFGTGYHLWYISATIVAIIIIYILQKKLSIKYILFISFFLFVLGSFETYYGLIYGLIDFFKGGFLLRNIFDIILTTRNGIFFGFFFISLGSYIYVEENTIKNSLKGINSKIIFFTFVLMVESITIKKYGWAKDYNILFSTIPLSYYLFIKSINHRYITKNPTKTLFGNITKNIYFIHVLVITALSSYFSYLKFELFNTNGLFRFLIVALISILISCFLTLFKYRKSSSLFKINKRKGDLLYDNNCLSS